MLDRKGCERFGIAAAKRAPSIRSHLDRPRSKVASILCVTAKDHSIFVLIALVILIVLVVLAVRATAKPSTVGVMLVLWLWIMLAPLENNSKLPKPER